MGTQAQQAAPLHYEEIPFILVDGGYILIECRVNDSIEGKFGFDTGGGIHLLSEQLFEKAGASHIKGFTCHQAHGHRVDLETYGIHSLSMGSHTQTNPIITPFPGLEQMGIDGILSLKLFEDRAFTIDFPNKKIILETESSLQERARTGQEAQLRFMVYRDLAIDIFCEFTVYNEQGDSLIVELEVDTGRGYETKLDSKFMKFFNIEKDSTDHHKYAFNTNPDKPYDIFYTNISRLSVKDVPGNSMDKPEVVFQDNLIYDGLIGIELWKNSRLTIDIPNSRMIIN